MRTSHRPKMQRVAGAKRQISKRIGYPPDCPRTGPRSLYASPSLECLVLATNDPEAVSADMRGDIYRDAPLSHADRVPLERTRNGGALTIVIEALYRTFSEYRLRALDAMEVKSTKIAGVIVLKPERHLDDRGYFVEAFNERRIRGVGIASSFVQDNQSFSAERGTVRGLHFQFPPFSQAKIIRVLRGSIFDVAVDLRVGAPSYGMWVAERLTAEGGEQMLIPRGFAHGFCTLEPNTEVIYKVDDYYSKEHEGGLIWNDPTLAIDWPIAPDDVVLSEKDCKLGRFSDFVSPFSMTVPDA